MNETDRRRDIQVAHNEKHGHYFRKPFLRGVADMVGDSQAAEKNQGRRQ